MAPNSIRNDLIYVIVTKTVTGDQQSHIPD